MEIIKKIREKIEKIKRNKNLKNIINNFSIIECNMRKFSKNIVKNHLDKDQQIFNYIISISIIRIKEILDIEYSKKFFLEQRYSHGISSILSSYNNLIRGKNIFFYKLLYLFNYTCNQRLKIEMLQTNCNSYSFLHYGKIYDSFKDKFRHNIIHPCNMERFSNYGNRIIQNLLRVLEIDNILKIKTNKKNEYSINKNNDNYNQFFTYHYHIYFNVNTLIPWYNINKNIYMSNVLYIKKSNKSLNLRMSHLGNYSDELNTRIYFLNILAYCLERLYFKDITIENTKEYIIIFYYIIVLLMPFERGTSSIAEILLYSLWEKYIGSKIYINENVMLDVEALMLPFSIFYNNCFNKESENIYTPYIFEEDNSCEQQIINLEEILKNMKNTNENYLGYKEELIKLRRSKR